MQHSSRCLAYHSTNGAAYHSQRSELCLGDFSLPNSLKACTNECQVFLFLEACKLNFLFGENIVILRIVGSSSLEQKKFGGGGEPKEPT